MKTGLILGLGLACLALGVAFSPAAHASALDHKAVFTLSAPMEIPGRVLGPGTYIFRETEGEGNLVQILNQNNHKVMATLVAIPKQLTVPPSQATLALSELRNASPQRIGAWSYPGDRMAEEFVYSHHRPM